MQLRHELGLLAEPLELGLDDVFVDGHFLHATLELPHPFAGEVLALGQHRAVKLGLGW